jgi:DNA-binding GntR family transcriptional regulator
LILSKRHVLPYQPVSFFALLDPVVEVSTVSPISSTLLLTSRSRHLNAIEVAADKRILLALEQRNPEKARSAMEDHIKSATTNA